MLNQIWKDPTMLGLLREIEKYPLTCLGLYLFTKVAKWQQLLSRNCSMTLHLSYMVQTLTISNKFTENYVGMCIYCQLRLVRPLWFPTVCNRKWLRNKVPLSLLHKGLLHFKEDAIYACWLVYWNMRFQHILTYKYSWICQWEQ